MHVATPAKSLKFTSSACTSYSYTGVGPGLLPFQQPYQLVYNAFGNTPIELPLPVANLLTSTPVRSKQDKCKTNSEVNKVNKTLQPSYEAKRQQQCVQRLRKSRLKIKDFPNPVGRFTNTSSFFSIKPTNASR